MKYLLLKLRKSMMLVEIMLLIVGIYYFYNNAWYLKTEEKMLAFTGIAFFLACVFFDKTIYCKICEPAIKSFSDGMNREIGLNATSNDARNDSRNVTLFIDLKSKKEENETKEKLIANSEQSAEFLKLQEMEEILKKQFMELEEMKSVSRLARGLAMDLNNDLSVIIGYASIAIHCIEPNHSLSPYFSAILKAGISSGNTIKQFLGFNDKEAIDLNKTAEQTIVMFRQAIGENINLDWKPMPSLWQVNLSKPKINQILTILLLNARNAIQGMGKIIIETDNIVFNSNETNLSDSLAGEYVMISVADNGCGMGKDIIEHIFEPFFSIERQCKRLRLGGLAMVREIVNQNAGLISVHSEPGKGSTFKIYFPRYIK
ncbi:MAG: hypothetical protein HUU50_07530 [Candidatus Brocadiae bacterium]|nr:hypothetical protein [Candidatus Brocadiia bacterium]